MLSKSNAMDTTSMVLEITVLSGEELFVGRKQRVRRNAFAVVKTDTSNWQRTNEDKDGASNPAWNEKIVMNLPNHARYFTVEVHCKTSIGNKFVGAINIPTTDFVGRYASQGYLHFLSYRLRDLNGDRNGIVNLSVKVKMSGSSSSGYDTNGPRPWTGVGVPVDGNKISSSGVVTGFPVGYK